MFRKGSELAVVISLLFATSACGRVQPQVSSKEPRRIRNTGGLQLVVVEENVQPTLRIVLPGHSALDRAIEVIFPEHVRPGCLIFDLGRPPVVEDLVHRRADGAPGVEHVVHQHDRRVRHRKVDVARVDDRLVVRAADADVVAIHTDQVRTEDARDAGPVHVGHQLWQALTLDSILAAAGLSARTRVLTELMTLNRLVSPAAEHAMPDWIRRTALADILAADFRALSDQALYRNLDRLHPQRAAIEQALAARERTLDEHTGQRRARQLLDYLQSGFSVHEHGRGGTQPGRLEVVQ